MTFGLITSKESNYRNLHTYFRHLYGEEIPQIEKDAAKHNGVTSCQRQFNGMTAPVVVVGVCFENEQDMLNFKEEFKDTYAMEIKNSLNPGISKEILF